MQLKHLLCYYCFSSLTVEDEVRQISRLIACFIFRVDYGNDFEKYLNFYMEARGAFIRLDYVQSALVQVRQQCPQPLFDTPIFILQRALFFFLLYKEEVVFKINKYLYCQ